MTDAFIAETMSHYQNKENLVKAEDRENVVEISDGENDMAPIVVNDVQMNDEYKAENAMNGGPVAAMNGENVGKSVLQEPNETRSTTGSVHGTNRQQRVEMIGSPVAGTSAVNGANAGTIARERTESRSTGRMNSVNGSKRGNGIRCEVCQEKFSTIRLLINHRKVHFDLHPIHCRVCLRIFSNVHARMAHEKECNQKRYECYVCGMNQIWYGVMKIHMRVHSGIKPYACSKCKVKRFKRLGDRTRHEKVCKK